MKVVYTDEAVHNLDEIIAFIAANYPFVLAGFEQRLRAVERRIARWPLSAAEVTQRPGVRMVPLLRYPYKVFYQIGVDAVEVLHVHHAAREEPPLQPE